jgi:archaemetzincin
MKHIYLRSLGSIRNALLDSLAGSLQSVFPVEVKMQEDIEYPLYAFEPRRNQYYAKKIIEHVNLTLPDDCEKMVCVTDVDLCAPVLTFVYGEAQLGGSVAVVSCFRLRQEYFSLLANSVLLADRLAKECVHELGHCFGLFHCNDSRCVMFFSNNIISIDNKEKDFCPNCRKFFDLMARKENND